MPEARDKATRFASDLVESAAAEGARQSRSARQQLDYWVQLPDRWAADRGTVDQWDLVGSASWPP
jgi:hypothetical protein